MARMRQMHGRGLVVVVAAVALLVIGGTAVIATHDFPDVADSAFYHGDVDWLVDRGITGGFPDGTYKPNNAVTRGQMATFLHKTAGATVAAGIHVTRDGDDNAVIESYFNNVNGVAPTLASATGDGEYDLDVGFATADKFALCNVDTNFTDTRDAFCTTSTPSGETVRIRIWDISVGGHGPAEFWVLVYGDAF